jgi:hypothetical protein
MSANRTAPSPAINATHELAVDQLETILGGHSLTASVAAVVILSAELVGLTGIIAATQVANAL